VDREVHESSTRQLNFSLVNLLSPCFPQLYEITSVNLPVMTIAIGVPALAAAIAGIIPARRAASSTPYGPCALNEPRLRT
jgi:hypothetical protein